MAITDDRVRPLAEVRVYTNGMGDPFVYNRDSAWYDVLLESAKYGTTPVDANGQSTLELLEGTGLVCRPFFVLQSALITKYATSGGTWETRTPSSGAPRVSRIVQTNSAASVSWSATSSFALPANPSVLFSFILVDSPSDWDSTALPPYLRIEFGQVSGQAQWALQFSKVYGSHLLRWVGGAWQAAMEIDEPQAVGNTDLGERFVLLRCLRNRVGVSCDYGKSYKWFYFADGTAAVVNSSPYAWRGQGGMAILGLHQVRYYAGTYTSPTRPMGPGPFGGSASLTSPSGGNLLPAGTSISLVNTSSPGSGSASYTAAFTPAATAGVPFTFYSTPELYSTLLTYPASTAFSNLKSYILPFDSAAFSVNIEKPYELDCSTCTLRIRVNASAAFLWSQGRWAKMLVRLGEAVEGGGERWWTAFAGHVRALTPSQGEYNKVELQVVLDNASIRFKRRTWTDFNARPLGGRTVNAALDLILATEGLDSSYRSWHPQGDLVTLPAGTPENPCEWPKRGEPKWETMRRIAGYAGLELAVADDGTLLTGLRNYVPFFVARTLQANPATATLGTVIEGVDYTADSCEAATAVIVQGQDQYGATRWAYVTDTTAEQDRLSTRFSPWREELQEEVSGTVTPGLLALRAQALAAEAFTPKLDATVDLAAVNLDVQRREKVVCTGLSQVGIGDADTHVVFTVRHHYEAVMARCKTQIGLRRVS